MAALTIMSSQHIFQKTFLEECGLFYWKIPDPAVKACPFKYPFGSAEEMIYVHNFTNRSLGQETLRIAIELVDVAPDC